MVRNNHIKLLSNLTFCMVIDEPIIAIMLRALSGRPVLRYFTGRKHST
ncbi:hypothetical protein P20439_0629 [Pseudoalteromonas sp. BSi20439]|nr:hypothetical protein P20439_0629 [Pseudoalteromonas sp. BSi20439]